MFQRIKCLFNRHDWHSVTDKGNAETFWQCVGCDDRRETDPHAGDVWRAHSGGTTSISGGGFGI